MKAVEKTKHTGLASIEQTCQHFDMHRDAYYKYMIRKEKKETIYKQVLKLMKEERIGTRKLCHALQSCFEVNELKKREINISMTEENHCYVNAIAERVNGILKDEFYLDQCFFTTQNASIATDNAINIYNNKRLQYL